MNAHSPAGRLAQQLAQNAEAVCRHYLSRGHRQGRYWLVGDIDNNPGRSLYVRLKGADSGKGAAGKWTDAATGEHGDLLDLIARTHHLTRLRDVLDDARAFLRLPHPALSVWSRQNSPAPEGSPDSARRLFAMSRPLAGSLAETYLRARAITQLAHLPALRFHPRCYYRADVEAETQTWPALIAAVTDLSGTITGVHRTWLDRAGVDKAPLETPRRAMGHLLGNAVRFGSADDVLAAGEGIETMLSLRDALPGLAMAAGLSANHLAAMLLPSTLRILYVVRDADPAGDRATATLSQRAQSQGIEARMLSPRLDDFNDDLRKIGLTHLRQHLRTQLAPEHAERFLNRCASSMAVP
ncbi:MAG: toprim domain-containing protein [Alphaproteobacteria bacterium]|nr:toprim domain-containing protein [Alphaproteobacteria bacterium]MBL6938199.1 toprim domain-containing protein [Alphaproteobacteria bacterium]MBL7097255.1 toprim domain-containing protein [Alphaproteobacteria bacterium]